MAPVHHRHFTFRTLVKIGLMAGAFLLLGLYILWQARFLIAGPSITLSYEPPQVQNERVVTLEGDTRNITSLALNGRQIFTDPHGHFREELVLENGYTIINITATDRYGRTTTLERPFMYMPASLVIN